jgi:hypothetical protein
MGIAPKATVGVVSEFNTTTSDAILTAIAKLPYGGILLLESQLDEGLVRGFPIEVLDAEFAMIRLATALGITVVEAAGNRSNNDLDIYTDAGGNQILIGTAPGSGTQAPLW